MTIRILGAGVMGLVLATELHARGHAVELVDPEPVIGPHACSWWAGGMLAPACEAVTAGPRVARFGAEATPWWQRHSKGVICNGTLVLAPPRDHGALAQFSRRSRDHSLLDAEALALLEPDLAGRFSAGLFYEGEAHLSPRAALSDLAAGLAESGVPVLRQVGARSADLVIEARGLAARDALPDLRGVRGEMLLLRCPDVALSRPVRLLHPRIPLYIVPRGEGLYMLGATMVESDRRGGITARAVLELLTAAYALHPAFAEAELVEWGADARPAFSDNLPKLRRHGARLHANGLYRHGFLLSPALARMAADHIETGVIPEFMDEVRE